MPARTPNTWSTVTNAFRLRWCVPILATLERHDGAKLVTLCHELQAHQSAVRDAVDHLIKLGWVRRNTGYGHPLRPEYLLSARGERIAPACRRLDSALTSMNLREVGLRRWSVPVLGAVAHLDPARFAGIGQSLGPITARALSAALKDLAASTLIERHVLAGFPPRTEYRPTIRADELLPAVDQLRSAG